MCRERLGVAEQANDGGPATGVEGGDDLRPPQPRTRRATRMTAGERQRPDTPPPLLIGLRFPEADVQAVEPVQRDIAAHERDEFAAAERAGEPHQEDGGVAAFEDLIRPTRTVCPRLVDDGDDVGGQQWRPRGAGPLPRRCIVPPDPGQVAATNSLLPGAVCPARRWWKPMPATQRANVAGE